MCDRTDEMRREIIESLDTSNVFSSDGETEDAKIDYQALLQGDFVIVKPKDEFIKNDKFYVAHVLCATQNRVGYSRTIQNEFFETLWKPKRLFSLV